MRRIPKIFELNALSITLFYLVFALLWILLSDQVLTWITRDPLLISRYQTFKGLFYVGVTSIFLYVLIQQSNEKLSFVKERIDQALFAADMATWSIDLETKENITSKKHHKLFGLDEKPKQWPLSTFYSYVHPDDRERIESDLNQAIENESTYEAEFRVIWPDESIHWMRSRGSVQKDKFGQKKRIAGTISDVTEKRELEEEYAHERELFESIFEQIPVMVDIYDPEINKIRVNKSLEKTLGWTNQEIQEINFLEKCYPDPEIRQKAVKVMKEANGEWYEFEVKNKAGETKIQSWSNIRLSDNTIVGIGLDVTDLKASQAGIRESRELLKKTFESLQDSVIILDPDTRTITNCNQSTCNIFGYTMEELIGSSTQKLHVSKASFEKFGELGAEDFENKGFFKTEFVMKRKDGSLFYSDHTITLVKNDDDEIEKIVSVVRDITEKKKQEKELQDLANRYQAAEEIANIGHWKRNINTDEAIWSKGFYDIIGAEPGSLDTSYESLLNMIHPEDRKEYDAVFNEARKTGSFNIRYRLTKPGTGEIGYYQELGKTEYDEDGNPVAISGTIQDVTEREEFQMKLKQHNEFIETTIENLPIGVAVNLIDEGTVTLMNKKFTEIYGWPRKVLTDTQTFFEKIFPNETYRKRVMEMYNADIKSENPERMQWKGIEITTQSGEQKIINAKNIPVYPQNLMIYTVVDVTAQAEAERKLAESEHNYRLLFQKSPLPMWIYDPETLKFVEVNNAAVKHYGYSRKEFYKMTLLDIRPEEDREAVKQAVQNPNESSQAESWRHIKKSGEIIYVLITSSVIDYFGHPYRLILVNDITEQKKTEEKVLSSLVEGENKERARIARELHDGLGQYLAAANMNLDAVQSSIDNLEEREQKQFQKGLTLLQHAVNETTHISRNLMPRVVDDYGLALAIEALVDNYSSNTDMSIKYYQNIDDIKLPREVEFNLYRIAQEGLSNAVKYSGASQINIQLIKDELDLNLTIDDNGIGFDTSSSEFTKGLGLQTIKTRTGALGGQFEVDSTPGKGTFINVSVPVHN